jgi:hypothetical protein
MAAATVVRMQADADCLIDISSSQLDPGFRVVRPSGSDSPIVVPRLRLPDFALAMDR